MPSEPTANSRRTDASRGRFVVWIAVLALLAAIYALLRIDSMSSKLSAARWTVGELQNAQTVLRADQEKLNVQLENARSQLVEFAELQKEVNVLATSIDELRGRTDRPQRTWARAEALYLLQLADRELQFTHEVDTALVAVEAADARLAELRDPALSAVRTQIGKDLQALRAVHTPDRNDIGLKLNEAATQITQLKVAGTVLSERNELHAETLPASGMNRAWAMIKRTVNNLFSIRQVSGPAAELVSTDEQALRREHLQLLLSSAQLALTAHDLPAYKSALNSAVRWLQTSFDQNDNAVAALAAKLTSLSQIDIAPSLPTLKQSTQLLERFVSGSEGP